MIDIVFSGEGGGDWRDGEQFLHMLHQRHSQCGGQRGTSHVAHDHRVGEHWK